MISIKTIFKIATLISILMVYYSCKPSQHEGDEHHIMEHISVAERVKKNNDSVQYSVSTAQALQQMKMVLADIHDTVSYLIPERSSQIKSFPCTNCHSKPVDQLRFGEKTKEKKAHWDIKIIHGNEDVMNCYTCHTKSNLNELVSLTGKSIVFDQSFKLCSQCHTTQFKDWVGGSHGKRLGGWAPPKAINSCVNCHNPHQPAFESRWPSRLNTRSKSKIKPE